jgi:hypothetical protein
VQPPPGLKQICVCVLLRVMSDAQETVMFINVVSPTIKNNKMNVLKKNVFERIVYNFSPF